MVADEGKEGEMLMRLCGGGAGERYETQCCWFWILVGDFLLYFFGFCGNLVVR